MKGQACSCNKEFSEFTPYNLVDYDRIIICKPISIDTIGNNIHYRSIVSKTYWGQKKDTVTITTPLMHGMCGLYLDFNESYLIYGTGDNIIAINICSPSRKLNRLKNSYFEKVNPTDSVWLDINNNYGGHPISFVKEYFVKTDSLEIAYLEIISKTQNGKIVTKFSNNTISAEINFKDGKLNGMATYYYANGKTKLKGSFTNNSREGIWTEYVFITREAKSFYISWTGKYINNEQHGMWKGKMLIGNFEEFNSYYMCNLNTDYK